MGIGALIGGALGLGASLFGARKQRKAEKRSLAAEQQAEADPVQTEQAVDQIETQREELVGNKAKTRKRRVNLFQTQGGVKGQELEVGQVGGRRTLLGN